MKTHNFCRMLFLLSLSTVHTSIATKTWGAECIRPDIISDVRSKNWTETLKTVYQIQKINELNEAQVEAVAELEAYLDYELVFLARDGEHLYDTLKSLLFQIAPEELSRIHLLNVSRPHIGDSGNPLGPRKMDPHLKAYLEQEGISEVAIDAGKKFLFVDTGYLGTIPDTIKNLNPKFYGQFKTHLLSSGTLKIPSTRVFLYGLNPNAAKMTALDFRQALETYEYLPKFYDRSTHYALKGDQWVPDAPAAEWYINGTKGTDGTVDPIAARYMSENLKYYTELESTQTLFKKRRDFWKKIGIAIHHNAQMEVEAALNEIFQSNDLKKESIAQDVYEIITRNYKEFPQAVPNLSKWNLIPVEPLAPDSGPQHWPPLLFPSEEDKNENLKAQLDLFCSSSLWAKRSATIGLIHHLLLGESRKIDWIILHNLETVSDSPELLNILIERFKHPDLPNSNLIVDLLVSAQIKQKNPKVLIELEQAKKAGNIYAKRALNQLSKGTKGYWGCSLS